ncbi:MAG: (2Fe-2S) ferredoxin domain-containing protein [Planctomycetota bacterium]|jgi:(2Fe-2S) ferredoxin
MTDCSQLATIAQDLKIGEYSRHVLLCIGETCCSAEQGRAAWTKLKNLLKERKLSLATGPNACYRSKVDCLRICKGGPILVVYPEGLWYAGMTEDRIERFVDEQIVHGRPIEEWIFARNPLPRTNPPADST